jgi:hypothetical protein
MCIIQEVISASSSKTKLQQKQALAHTLQLEDSQQTPSKSHKEAASLRLFKILVFRVRYKTRKSSRFFCLEEIECRS